MPSYAHWQHAPHSVLPSPSFIVKRATVESAPCANATYWHTYWLSATASTLPDAALQVEPVVRR